jgi:2-polyprenyl-3-methyl-5-hydroxy-6-metoxy-1,4-benzoquinol methylase
MLDLTSGAIPNEDMYDTITCIGVMQHVINPKFVLCDIVRHLKTRGRLIISDLDLWCEFNPARSAMEFDAAKLLNSLEVFKAEKDWLWVKS